MRRIGGEGEDAGQKETVLNGASDPLDISLCFPTSRIHVGLAYYGMLDV